MAVPSSPPSPTSKPSTPATGTRITFRDQNPTITINGKQYKITQIQMRKAGETTWQKVDFKTVDLKVLAEKCQLVFENTKPTQEQLSKLSFIFKKDNKSGTPLILREIKYLQNHATDMETVEVKVSLQSELSHHFVDALFHPAQRPDKKRKISPTPALSPAAHALPPPSTTPPPPVPALPPLLVDLDAPPDNPHLPHPTDRALD